MKKLFILTTALASVISSSAFAEDMLVERVRYCTAATALNVCPSNAINSKFSAWETNNTARNGQLETYISIINQPERSKVKRVVFVSSGQQTKPNSKGYANALTGQPNNFKQGCANRTKSCWRSIHPDSLVARLRASGEFTDNETLYISAIDARFGYFVQSDEKQRRENAYWDFLTSKFDPANVELIVLAGQSRGGCLVFRLGSRMRKSSAHKDIPLMVQGYDPVCRTPDRNYSNMELPKGTPAIYKNPLDRSKKESHVVNMDLVFPPNRRENLKVLSINGGGKVVPIDGSVRSFIWKSNDVDLGWWKQKWVNYKHNEMGGYLHDNDVDTFRARTAIGDVGYGDIYNFSRYDLGRPKPTNFVAKQRFPVDVNGDRKSDIILAYQASMHSPLLLRTKLSNGDGTFTNVTHQLNDGFCSARDVPIMSGYFDADRKTDILRLCQGPNTGLALRTKMSNGDGTYSSKQHVSGEPPTILNMPAFVGDVNGDGLSDVILRYQHPSEGLHIVTKFSQGDGSFTEHDFKAGDRNLGGKLRTHIGDVNKDKKTDLIYIHKRSDSNMEIRTRISNGDGTFGYVKSEPIKWINWDNLQTFVADVNRDKRTDIIVLNRDNEGRLSARTYISKGDGSYIFTSDAFTDDDAVDTLETIIVDVNGDFRSDIVMRVRHATRGLLIRVKQSNGDGKYTSKEYEAGDDFHVDNLRLLTGNYNADRYGDLALRYRNGQQGLVIHTKMGTQAGSFTQHQFDSGDGSVFDGMDALSGPIIWNGGGTFPRPAGDGKIVEIGQIRAKPMPKPKPVLKKGMVKK